MCDSVLDNHSLISGLDEINKKGNLCKHTIETNKIDVGKAVINFNNLINLIITKYKLTALNRIILKKRNIEKNVNAKTQIISNDNNVKKSNTNNKNNKSKNNDNIKASFTDEHIKLTAALISGDGRYTKGILWWKKSMVNFQLRVSVYNPDDLRIKKAIAQLKCKNNLKTIKIPTDEESTTKINLDTSEFYGKIQVVVMLTYKLGLSKTKQIKTILSKEM